MWRKLIYLSLIVIINSFLGLVNIIYSNFDLFKINLTEKRKEKTNIKKIKINIK